MNQVSLAKGLLGEVSSIAKNASMLMTDKANHNEMMIFNILMTEKAETGKARIQLSEISRRLCITRPAVTQCVDRLVTRDMLIRCSDPDDRRAVYVEMTDSGREYYQAIMKNALEMVNSIVNRMGKENACQLVSLLGELNGAIKEEANLR